MVIVLLYWNVCRLGDIVFIIIGGGMLLKSYFEYWYGDIFWVSVKDFKDF